MAVLDGFPDDQVSCSSGCAEDEELHVLGRYMGSGQPFEYKTESMDRILVRSRGYACVGKEFRC